MSYISAISSHLNNISLDLPEATSAKVSAKMSVVDYELHLAICKPDFLNRRHWLIVMIEPGASRGTYLHCTGNVGDRRTEIEPNRRFKSWKFEKTYHLSTVLSDAASVICQQALAIPPQSCSCWVVYLIFRLERRSLVPHGTYDHWRRRVTHRMEDLGPGCYCD